MFGEEYAAVTDAFIMDVGALKSVCLCGLGGSFVVVFSVLSAESIGMDFFVVMGVRMRSLVYESV